jgi:hypothetical protein
MADDIVSRLKHRARRRANDKQIPEGGPHGQDSIDNPKPEHYLEWTAAEEIVKLRKALKRLRELHSRHTAAVYDKITEALEN